MMWYVKIYLGKMTSNNVRPRKSEKYGVSTEYQSLNYDVCENSLLLDEERERGYKLVLKKQLFRLLCFALIGIVTAVIGFAVELASEQITWHKNTFVKKYIDSCVKENCLYIPLLIWAGINTVLVVIGSLLVTYIEPTCKGSGVPAVMAYLNGIRMPKTFRLRTLFVRSFGIVLSYGGGLAVGKEGPMVHAGAIVGSGISQGKSTALNHDFNFFTYFREDREKRDFVAGGASAGVTAAFAAPIGGVIFSMEGCTSFLSQSLPWQMLFGNLISSFVLNSLLSVYHKHNDLSHRSLLNLGKYDELKYRFEEIPIFVLIGVMGGLLGALHNQLQVYMKNVRSFLKIKGFFLIIEGAIVAIISAAVAFVTIIYFGNDCKLQENVAVSAAEPEKMIFAQVFCEDNEFNDIATIWFQTPQSMLRYILHEPHTAIAPMSLIVFGISFYLLATVTYGISASAGLFIPAMVSGAVWGRLMGVVSGKYIFHDMSWPFFGKYAMLGAAAQLTGVLRLTLSLVVIVIETTGNIDMSLPLIIVVLVARWTGNLFNESVYAKQMQIKNIPYLETDPPPLSTHITAAEVMKKPVVSFKTVENVGNIVDVLKATTHSGFPVIGPLTTTTKKNEEDRFRGLILRSQLITLLEIRHFGNTPGSEASEYVSRKRIMSLDTFRYKYPHYTKIELVPITEDERKNTINLVPYMNNSAYTVYETASLPRAFKLFRGLGLRHLVVVNDENNVVGIITRVNLAKYRELSKNCSIGLVEIEVLEHQ